MVCLKEWRFRGLCAMKRTLPQFLREHRRSGVTRNETNKQQAHHEKKLLFVGLDVHAKSITIGLAEGARKDFVRLQEFAFASAAPETVRTGTGVGE